jgi:hypothetical protein
MSDELAAEHRQAAAAHEEAANRHDEAAVTFLAQGEVERAGRELLDAMIERQLAQDERELAALESARGLPPEGEISGNDPEAHARLQ